MWMLVKYTAIMISVILMRSKVNANWGLTHPVLLHRYSPCNLHQIPSPVRSFQPSLLLVHLHWKELALVTSNKSNRRYPENKNQVPQGIRHNYPTSIQLALYTNLEVPTISHCLQSLNALMQSFEYISIQMESLPGGSACKEHNSLQLLVIEEVVEWPYAAFLSIRVWAQIWIIAGIQGITTLPSIQEEVGDSEEKLHRPVNVTFSESNLFIYCAPELLLKSAKLLSNSCKQLTVHCISNPLWSQR